MDNKYRLQRSYPNPEPVIRHSGKLRRWVDAGAFRVLSDAKRWVEDHPSDLPTRVIRLCARSEAAECLDSQVYPGRRFRIVVDANEEARKCQQ